MPRSAISLVAAITLLVIPWHELFGQTTQAQVAVGGGIATDARGITSQALTVAPSVTFAPDPRISFGLSAGATRFPNQQWSLAGGASSAARLPLGAFAALTFNGGAQATTTSYSANYGTVDAIPAAEVRAGPFAVFAGAHAAYGQSSLATSTQTALGSVPGSTSTSTSSRSSIGPVFGGLAQVTGADETLVAGYREERSTVLGIPIADRTLTASVSNGALTVAASYGARAAADENTTFGSGSLSIALPASSSLELGGGTYPSNRITGVPGGRYLSLGLALHIGAPPSEVPNDIRLPAPDDVPAPARGYTRLSIRAGEASRVEVAGDWSGWKPTITTRASNGVWYADLKIAPGRYRYAFRVDGSAWRVPDGAAAVDDGFGGKSAWLTVPDSGAVTEQH